MSTDKGFSQRARVQVRPHGGLQTSKEPAQIPLAIPRCSLMIAVIDAKDSVGRTAKKMGGSGRVRIRRHPTGLATPGGHGQNTLGPRNKNPGSPTRCLDAGPADFSFSAEIPPA
jgi:hypothetical protein